MVSLSANVFAQIGQPVEPSDNPSVVGVSDAKVSGPPLAQWAECSALFANYVHALPKQKQAAEFESWWALNDRVFWMVRRDEFRMKDERPKKTAEFEKVVAASPQPAALSVRVKLGNYDSKRNGFPVEYSVGTSNKWILDQETGGLSGGGIGGQSSTVNCMHVDGTLPNRPRFPDEAHFVFTNLAKANFIPCGEEQARIISAQLGGSRTSKMRIEFIPGVTKVSMDRFIGPVIVTESKLNKAIIGHENAVCNLKL